MIILMTNFSHWCFIKLLKKVRKKLRKISSLYDKNTWPDVFAFLLPFFLSPTQPHWAKLVIQSPCLCVCVLGNLKHTFFRFSNICQNRPMEVGWVEEGGMVGNIVLLASHLSHLTRYHRPPKSYFALFGVGSVISRAYPVYFFFIFPHT